MSPTYLASDNGVAMLKKVSCAFVINMHDVKINIKFAMHGALDWKPAVCVTSF